MTIPKLWLYDGHDFWGASDKASSSNQNKVALVSPSCIGNFLGVKIDVVSCIHLVASFV